VHAALAVDIALPLTIAFHLDHHDCYLYSYTISQTNASPQLAGVAVQAPTVWSQHSSTGADTTTVHSSMAQSQSSTAESSPRQSANGRL
jgi:hypothetical protein